MELCMDLDFDLDLDQDLGVELDVEKYFESNCFPHGLDQCVQKHCVLQPVASTMVIFVAVCN